MKPIRDAVLLYAFMFAALTFAHFAVAAEAPKLNVEQVIQVMNGLAQLDGATDKDGKIIPGQAFKFSGPTRMKIAVNLDRARAEFRLFQAATNALVSQLSGGGSTVPDEKRAEFATESAKILAAPASVTLLRLKEADLNLDQNQIPGTTLSFLIPIIDQ